MPATGRPSAASTAPERNLSWQSANSESSAPIVCKPVQPGQRRCRRRRGNRRRRRSASRPACVPAIAAGQLCRGVVERDRRKVEAARRAGFGDARRTPGKIGRLRQIGGDLGGTRRPQILGAQALRRRLLRLVDQKQFGFCWDDSRSFAIRPESARRRSEHRHAARSAPLTGSRAGMSCRLRDRPRAPPRPCLRRRR